jgi:hypothetical protein
MNRLKQLSEELDGMYFSVLINTYGYKIGYKSNGSVKKAGPAKYKETFDEAYVLFLNYMIKDCDKAIKNFKVWGINETDRSYQNTLQQKEIYEEYLKI